VLKFAAVRAPAAGGSSALERFKALLAAGASPRAPLFAEGVPPVCLAAAAGDADVLAALLAAAAAAAPVGADGAPLPGADLHSDAARRNAIHYAAARGHGALVATLKAKMGADAAGAADRGGSTPAHLAVLRGHAALATELLAGVPAGELAARISSQAKDGRSLFHLALSAQASPEAEELAAKYVTVLAEAEAAANAAAEAAAVAKGKPAAAAARPPSLLNAPTGTKARDTPLILALRSHQDGTVVALLARGASMVAPNGAGETPLAALLAERAGRARRALL
jgi:ankyrin repeat protein